MTRALKVTDGRAIPVLLAAGWMLAIGTAAAQTESTEAPFDLTAKTGVAVGKLSVEAPDSATTRTLTIGGVPAELDLNRDFSPKVSGLLDIGVLLDVVNRQVIRQSFGAGFAYHVLGGSRHLVDANAFGSIETRRPYSLSLLFTAGVADLSSSSPNSAANGFSGSLFETNLGLEYRVDTSPNNARGVTIQSTLLTLPSSQSRIAYTMVEVMVFIRHEFN